MIEASYFDAITSANGCREYPAFKCLSRTVAKFSLGGIFYYHCRMEKRQDQNVLLL